MCSDQFEFFQWKWDPFKRVWNFQFFKFDFHPRRNRKYLDDCERRIFQNQNWSVAFVIKSIWSSVRIFLDQLINFGFEKFSCHRDPSTFDSNESKFEKLQVPNAFKWTPCSLQKFELITAQLYKLNVFNILRWEKLLYFFQIKLKLKLSIFLKFIKFTCTL